MAAIPELPWIAEARKHVGLHEIKGKSHSMTIVSWLVNLGAWWREDETAWCGTYIAHCLRTAKVGIPKHWYRALDYLNYGKRLDKPAYGCVAVKTRKGGGHVAFVVGKLTDGRLVCLGGNQNDMVSYAVYKSSDFEAFMWYGQTLAPATHRYELPVLKSVSTLQVTEA